jgi:tRNA nucleotidyltransferase/poly(A) polymerase
VGLSPASVKERIEKDGVVMKVRRHRFAGAVFLVGGALRELALGSTPNDYDFALERGEDLSAFEQILGSRGFLLGKKPIRTHRIVAGDIAVDITTIEGSIEEDLRRRDFTINAVAYALGDGAIIDPLHGFKDIEERVLRYPRKESLRADPLRMVKAVRHLAALRGFILDPALKNAIEVHRKLIKKTAVERIKYELDLIMLSRNPYRGLKTMEETRLLFEIFPELVLLEEMDREKHLEPKALTHTIDGFRHVNKVRRFHPLMEKEAKHWGYGLLFHDLGKPRTFFCDEENGHVHFYYHERHSRDIAARIMERLKFAASEMKAILSLIENHMRIFLISNREATEKATRRLVYRMEELTPSLVFLTLLDLYGNTKGKENASTLQVRNRCSEVLAAFDEWRSEPLPRIVTGHDLLALGFGQGPVLGQVLQEIREKQIAGEITEKAEALRYAAARQAG